jgi:quinol-cytochrome oxidoreductase complex cytochrome b subunit
VIEENEQPVEEERGSDSEPEEQDYDDPNDFWVYKLLPNNVIVRYFDISYFLATFFIPGFFVYASDPLQISYQSIPRGFSLGNTLGKPVP